MATLPSSSSSLSSKLQSLTLNNISNNSSLQHPMMFFFFTGFILSLCFTISFILYRKTEPKTQRPHTIESNSQENPEIKFQSLAEKNHQNDKTDTTHLAIDEDDDDPGSVVAGSDCCDDGKVRVKKKRKKKKKRAKKNKEEEEEEEEKERELVCLYPFTSTGSATQRKIKQQYDHLVRCNSSKGLTLAQVGEFANCLIDARNELQHKSEVIQRKFTIAKALLFKADRSSFDRLHQQIYKLEVEQKRLEEDAFVYNWLQEQLKLSPAYKKMLEISESMELKAKSKELAESRDDEFCGISFEELLAQEKKDSFWQKNGKARQWSR